MRRALVAVPMLLVLGSADAAEPKRVRYNPTRLNDADSDYCDPFGFCQDSLNRFEVMAGLVLRF